MVMVENYCSDPIPTVQVINEPRTLLPRAKQALSLDKGQGKHNKIYKSQRQGEDESRGMGERTRGGNGVKLSSSLSLYGNRVRTGGGRGRVSESMSGPGQRAWLRRPPRILSLERMRAGPGIPAWFCHSSHFLLKRHSERNTFKTGETNGDREGAIMCC